MPDWIVPVHITVTSEDGEEAAKTVGDLISTFTQRFEIGEPYREPVVPDPEDPEFFRALTEELRRLERHEEATRLQVAHETINALNKIGDLNQSAYGRIHACHSVIIMARQKAQGTWTGDVAAAQFGGTG